MSIVVDRSPIQGDPLLMRQPQNPAEWTMFMRELDKKLNIASGNFTATLTGCTTSPTGQIYWSSAGKNVTLWMGIIRGTSNAGTATLTGLPTALIPVRGQGYFRTFVENGGVFVDGTVEITTSGVIVLYVGTPDIAVAFGAALGKGTRLTTFTYSLA